MSVCVCVLSDSGSSREEGRGKSYHTFWLTGLFYLYTRADFSRERGEREKLSHVLTSVKRDKILQVSKETKRPNINGKEA